MTVTTFTPRVARIVVPRSMPRPVVYVGWDWRCLAVGLFAGGIAIWLDVLFDLYERPTHYEITSMHRLAWGRAVKVGNGVTVWRRVIPVDRWKNGAGG